MHSLYAASVIIFIYFIPHALLFVAWQTATSPSSFTLRLVHLFLLFHYQSRDGILLTWVARTFRRRLKYRFYCFPGGVARARLRFIRPLLMRGLILSESHMYNNSSAMRVLWDLLLDAPRPPEPVTNSTVGPSIRLCDVEPEREIRTIMMTGSSVINPLENMRRRGVRFLEGHYSWTEVILPFLINAFPSVWFLILLFNINIKFN